MKERVGDEKLIIGVVVRDINDHVCLWAAAPLKLRPYGAIEICLLLLLLYFLPQVVKIPEVKN